MTNDTTQPDWTPRIVATFAVVLALVGVASFVGGAVRTGPAVSLTTTCAGFAADAFKSFNTGDNVTLSAPFAPGDHVHLALDFKGAGYSWKTTGVLGPAKTDVTGSGWFETNTTFIGTRAESDAPEHTADTTLDSAASASGTSTSAEPPAPKYKESTTSGVAQGDIDGITRLDIDVEVATAGDGAITISQRGSLLLAVSQKVAIASCTAAKEAPAPSSGDVSNNGSTRSLSAPTG